MIPRLIGLALLSAFATASQAQQPAPSDTNAAPPAGTLTGRIMNQAGEPLPSATVYVSTLGMSSSNRTAKVDANGSFKIDGLAVGVYVVFATEPGFVLYPPLSPTEGRRYYHTGDSVSLTLVKGGVITGKVTTAINTPVVAAAIRAFRIKDENGQSVPSVIQTGERLTDDRGIYRIYGLPPGVYVVSAGGQSRSGGVTSPYESDAPTYAPSGTRDTASEIGVRSGEETTLDIQYRGEPGHAVSGTVAGLTESQSLVTITASINLTDATTHALLMSVPSSSFNNYSFAFYGVPDGEYELAGYQYSPNRETISSEPRRITVQGADLTGIKLSLAPLASIAGQLVVESDAKINCVKRRATASQETVILARRFLQEAKLDANQKERAQQSTETRAGFVNLTSDGVPDTKGDFTLKNLRKGSYSIDPVLSDAGWYVRSIAIGTATAAKTSNANVARDGITVRSGERVSGLTITIAEGAASLRGRVTVDEEQKLPPGLRVYLVPAEPESAENVVRFFEARADGDGTFALGNIAPGRYWIIARPDDESDPTKVKSIRRDSVLRVKILREAEGLKKEISFKPCERPTDYDLRYLAAGTAPKP